jgi:hypothetical protein
VAPSAIVAGKCLPYLMVSAIEIAMVLATRPRLLRLCRIADPLYALYHAFYALHPKLAAISHLCLPVSLDPDREWRWLGTFDWYSPRYQWKHSYEEVEGWYREAGLTAIRRGSFPVSVWGRRPPSVSPGSSDRP